ncbi:hypothetical protein CALCODRAFT_505190 [Calocera cornea HHB12733]|uniref:Uncharacterized protein n=1 Tax=Calocera cornea HHB12733 TaxID=1353952 RepID=A0A166JFU8_9BASI|nr:hypothetical protein CALCODRAFT_505190 [Calocera cornea HHB12733]
MSAQQPTTTPSTAAFDHNTSPTSEAVLFRQRLHWVLAACPLLLDSFKGQYQRCGGWLYPKAHVYAAKLGKLGPFPYVGYPLDSHLDVLTARQEEASDMLIPPLESTTMHNTPEQLLTAVDNHIDELTERMKNDIEEFGRDMQLTMQSKLREVVEDARVKMIKQLKRGRTEENGREDEQPAMKRVKFDKKSA